MIIVRQTAVNVAATSNDDYNNYSRNSSQSKHYDIAFIDHEPRWPSVSRVRLLSLQHIARYTCVASITSGQSSLTKLPHRRGIRQVAPVCTPMDPHFSLGPQPKLHLDQFDRFCTSHGKVSSGMSFLLEIVHSHGAIWTPSKIPWAHPSPQPKRHLDRFSRFCTTQDRASLYFTMGRLPTQNCPFPCPFL